MKNNMSLIYNTNNIGKILYNGNDISKALFNGNIVWQKKPSGIIISGTVSDTRYTPAIYIGSTTTSGTTPTGGRWISATMDGNNWSIDLTPYLPFSGFSFGFYVYGSNGVNRYVNKIVIPSNLDFSQFTSFYQLFGSNYTSYSSLENIEGLENINTSSITNMSQMFYKCGNLKNFEFNLSNWDVSNVESFKYAFYSDTLINNNIIRGLNNWNVSKCSDFSYMFYGSKIDSDLSNWDVSRCSDFSYMFSNVTNPSLDFVNNWSINNAKITGMFYGCRNLTGRLNTENWNIADNTSLSSIFAENEKLSYVDITNWLPNKTFTGLYNTFRNCKALTYLGDLTNLNTSKVTNLEQTFLSCTGLISIGDLSGWDTSMVTTFRGTFYGCSGLTSIGDLSGWNTGNSTYMNDMFYGCSGLTSIGDLSGWNTGKVTDMSQMFRNCPKLTSIGDLSGWNTGKVTNMNNMFRDCKLLASVGDLSGWNTGNVTNMSYMFYNCINLTSVGDLSGWDTSKVTNISSMFTYTKLNNLGVPPIGDGLKRVSTSDMFYNCTELTNIIASGPIHNSVNFKQSPLTLDSAKIILNALQEPYSGSQTLTLNSSTMVLIMSDPEAQAIAQEKAALGWSITA